jgi:hypothetical protein
VKIELSENALKWQAIAREYADEYLQPHEVEAELNDGVLSAEITARNKKRRWIWAGTLCGLCSTSHFR